MGKGYKGDALRSTHVTRTGMMKVISKLELDVEASEVTSFEESFHHFQLRLLPWQRETV